MSRLKISLFFIALTILVTFPAIIFLPDKLIGDGGDGYQFLSFQYIAKRLFFSGQFPFGWTNFWRYPYGFEFQSGYDSSILIILGLIFYQLSSNPLLVYNMTVFTLLFLSLWLSYVFFRFFFDDILSIIGAIIYGLSFYTLSKVGGHTNLILAAVFPFFFYSVIHILREGGSWKSFGLAALATILVAFTSLQYALFLAGSLPIMALLSYLFYPEQSKQFLRICLDHKIRVLTAGVTIFIIFSLFHGGKLIDAYQGDLQLPVHEISSVPLINFILPNTYLDTITTHFTPNTSKEWIEYAGFGGYVEIGLFLCAVFFLSKTKEKMFLITAFAIFFILALGKQTFLPAIWPYQYLFNIMPYRGIIEPGRFFIIFYIWFTLLILLYLKQLKNYRILSVILILLLIERVPWNFRMSESLYEPQFINAVQETQTKAVLDLPLYVDWWNGQKYDMYSVYYKKPVVNGYLHWSGNTPQAKKLVTELEVYSCYYEPQYAPQDFSLETALQKKEFLLKTMKSYGIHTLVLHKDLYLDTDHCARADKYLKVLLADSERWLQVYKDKNKTVLWLKD